MLPIFIQNVWYYHFILGALQVDVNTNQEVAIFLFVDPIVAIPHLYSGWTK